MYCIILYRFLLFVFFFLVWNSFHLSIACENTLGGTRVSESPHNKIQNARRFNRRWKASCMYSVISCKIYTETSDCTSCSLRTGITCQIFAVLLLLLLRKNVTNNFDSRLHRRGWIFHGGGSAVWHRPVWSVGTGCHSPVGCRSRSVVVIDYFAVYNAPVTCNAFQWVGQPQKFVEGSRPHQVHGSLGPHESASQTASGLVQPFFAGLVNVTNRQTDTHTDRQTMLLSL